MNLYLIVSNDEQDYIEAESFGDAIAVWKDFLYRQGVEAEDPDSVTVVYDQAVLRRTEQV